jgi:hypothetical protein
MRADESPLLALYRDSWIVGDLLPAAGEAVEESGFAAVRDTD